MLDHFPFEMLSSRSDFERSSPRASRRFERCGWRSAEVVSGALDATGRRSAQAAPAVRRSDYFDHFSALDCCSAGVPGLRKPMIFKEPMI
jgi:hypothetical protein